MSPHRLPSDGITWRHRLLYLKMNAWELFAALLACVACVNYWLHPVNLAASAVGHVAFPDVMWNTMYGIGAVFVILGLAKPAIRLELAGLSLFSSAVTIQAAVLWHLYGGNAAASVAIFAGFACASLCRAYDLVTAR